MYGILVDLGHEPRAIFSSLRLCSLNIHLRQLIRDTYYAIGRLQFSRMAEEANEDNQDGVITVLVTGFGVCLNPHFGALK